MTIAKPVRDKAVALYQEGELPVAAICLLLNIGHARTVYDWLRKRKIPNRGHIKKIRTAARHGGPWR